MKGDVWRAAAEAAIRGAAGGKAGFDDLPPTIAEAARQVSTILSSVGGVCPLCGSGPFTQRGFYLHLVRVHISDVELMVRSLAEGIARGRLHGLA